VGTYQLIEIAVSLWDMGKMHLLLKKLSAQKITHILLNHSSAVLPGKDHLTTEKTARMPQSDTTEELTIDLKSARVFAKKKDLFDHESITKDVLLAFYTTFFRALRQKRTTRYE